MKRSSHNRDFAIQSLEKRTLLSAAPSSPRPDTLGAVFDSTERQTLLSRLTNLPSSTAKSLQTKLNTSVGQFDTMLASYMQARTNAHFFFDPADVTSDANFIKSNLSFSDTTTRGNEVADSHLFPDQTNAATYIVQLPTNVDWTSGAANSNPEFLHALNRMGFWLDLSESAVLTGNAKYANELAYEIASWSQQYTTANTPTFWSKTDQDGWLLDSALRVENWTWSYFMLLDNSGFSAAEDSLFMYKLVQQGDFLYSNALTTTDFGSNRTVSLAKSLLILGDMFPEVDNAAAWKTTAQNLLFKTMNTQLYQDGSQVEQSPGYTGNVAEDLLEARKLDEINGVTWPHDDVVLLSNAIDSYWQFLDPNGNRPAIGDTFRTAGYTFFLKANIIQGTTRWPAVKPRVRDVFIFGTSTISPFLSLPVTPTSLGTRGKTYAMSNSGNYIARSNDTASANQLTFDAGAKGGVHGHFDLLNFELFGGGRPLISDPGPYKYDTSASRAYVVSTQAHNTVNVDGQNIGDLEGDPTGQNGSIDVSQYTVDSNHEQITASHQGYEYLPGQPVVTRSIWYDLAGTMLIVDWGEGSVSHTFQQSFNLATEGDTNNVSVDAADFEAHTRYTSGSNVTIQGVSRPGQVAAKNPLTFVSNTASGDYKDDAYRFTISQTGTFVTFVTLVTAYGGMTAPNTTAVLMNTPTAGGIVKVMLTKNGVSQEVDFTPSPLHRLNASATNTGSYNDIAYDSKGNLHVVYDDAATGDLMYTVRGTNKKWSVPQIIDLPGGAIGVGDYEFISLALDNNGHPGVAYFNAWGGDLKYAYFDPISNSWQAQTLDSKGSTGLYPSLAYSRGNGAVISYYNHTKGDLDLAQAATGGYTITPIDTTGDVGRFSSLTLDPNRPTATKWAIGYEATSFGDFKYAIQGLFKGGTQLSGYTNFTVDNLVDGGGYVSLAFYDSGTNDTNRFKAAMSYYDANNSALRYAYATDNGSSWVPQTVANKNIQGLYTNLYFDPSSGKPTIFYFNRSANEAIIAVLSKGKWGFTTLAAGGREMHVSLDKAGDVAYSNLNGSLSVGII